MRSASCPAGRVVGIGAQRCSDSRYGLARAGADNEAARDFRARSGGLILLPLLLLLGFAAAGGCSSLAEPAGEESGFPPFYRRAEAPSKTEVQVLYPLYRRWYDGESTQTYIFPLFWDREFTGGEGEWRDADWACLPFLFGGSDTAEGDYFCFFPFYGNLRGLLAKDEIRIYGFPFYLETSERGYESWHVLWPLVSGGEGDGMSDFRVLPFWSTKEKEGKSWSRSLLWPFFTWGEEALDSEHPVSHFFFFPFYGARESDVEWTHTWLFPFFSDSGNAAGWRETNILFPIYRRITGEDEDALRIWPVYGYREKKDDFREWFLWPLFWHSDYPVPEGRVESFQAAFLFRDAARTTADGVPRGSDTWIWPLARRIEDAEGTAHVRFLSLFPFVDDGDFDANWAWLWTLLEARTGRDGTAVSLLSGLLGYEESGDETVLRLLWLFRIPL